MHLGLVGNTLFSLVVIFCINWVGTFEDLGSAVGSLMLTLLIGGAVLTFVAYITLFKGSYVKSLCVVAGVLQTMIFFWLVSVLWVVCTDPGTNESSRLNYIPIVVVFLPLITVSGLLAGINRVIVQGPP